MSRLQLLAPRVAAAVLAVVVPQVSAQAAITVFAAGSLRAALTEIVADFEAAPGGTSVKLVFGASGLLRDRLQAGEAADVFASANMEHPQALAASGRAEPALPFARNALCALAAPSFGLNGQPLQVLTLPDDLNVSATYGLSLLRPVSPAALRFVAHLRGAPGQRRLAAWGFAAP